MLRNGNLGVEEKSPIHIADVVRMYGLLISSLTKQPDQENPNRGIWKQHHLSAKEPSKSKKHSNEEQEGVSTKRHVRFDLQELGSRGQEEPRHKEEDGRGKSFNSYNGRVKCIRCAMVCSD